MLPIQGIFEVAISVKDLRGAEAFYTGILGLEICVRDEKRNWLFLWAGRQTGMLVLQENKSEFPKQHFAFSIAEADLEGSAEILRESGLAVNGPVSHLSMPGKSVYFTDPDGHELELYGV